jgi:hypothetical protein
LDNTQYLLSLGAAEIATLVMKQEMFDNELLNLLSVYSLLKWLELPAEQRLFDNKPKEKDVESDEDEHAMEEEEVNWQFSGVYNLPYFRSHSNSLSCVPNTMMVILIWKIR